MDIAEPSEVKCHLPNLQPGVIASQFVPHFLSGRPLARLPCCYLEDANSNGVVQHSPHLMRADLDVLTTTPGGQRRTPPAVSPKQALQG